MNGDKAHPYIKFYGRDWIGDTDLRMAELDERGLWIDLLSIMMACEPYGHLSVNGRPMTDREAAKLTGTDIDTYKGTLKRLIERGIPGKTDEGMIFSRRLVRDHARFMACSGAGKKGGGNPALRPPCIPPEMQNPESIDQKPEARSQKPHTKGTIKVPFIGAEAPHHVFDFEKTIPKEAKHADLYRETMTNPKVRLTTSYSEWFENFHSKGIVPTKETVAAVNVSMTNRPGPDWTRYENRILEFAIGDVAKTFGITSKTQDDRPRKRGFDLAHFESALNDVEVQLERGVSPGIIRDKYKGTLGRDGRHVVDHAIDRRREFEAQRRTGNAK